MKPLLTICTVVCLMFETTVLQASVITDVYRAGGASDDQPEIVAWPYGLQNAAQAYMDRWGKWPPNNEGYFYWEKIPDELVGADYVKTYNVDKHDADVIYAVTVSQEAKLYIFIDSRYVVAHGNPPFHWLTDGSSGAFFSDTGLRLLLYEEKILPKKSFNTRLFYIYAAEVSAGYYKLGPTDDGSGSRNFYGIAAVKSVSIDIKPGGYPNTINLDSHGTIPVAILSSPSFKATTVDPDTVVLGGSSVAVRGKVNRFMAHEEDVNSDGLTDLVCQVETENLNPGVLQTGYAVLAGKTYGGQPIQGSDEINIISVPLMAVIYYSFDSVGDVVMDESGKGHDAAVVGDVTAEAGGKYNGAARFSNAGYLDLDGPDFTAEDIPTFGMTLAAWIKCTNTGDHHAIFNARASDQTWVVHPEARSSGEFRWLLRAYGGATLFDIRAGVVTWDEWLHFAGTYDEASGKAMLYINGEVAKELDVKNPADIAGDWDLGARVGKNIDDARPFTGLMDEFRLFTQALSQDEIRNIMQGP